jgi:hypothetical protein
LHFYANSSSLYNQPPYSLTISRVVNSNIEDRHGPGFSQVAVPNLSNLKVLACNYIPREISTIKFQADSPLPISPRHNGTKADHRYKEQMQA